MTGKTVRNLEGRNRRFRSKYALVPVVAMMLFATAAQGAYFDTAGMGARPVGMGEVFLVAGGSAADYWYNPAGLSGVKERQAGISYGIPSGLGDLSVSQVNMVTPFGNGGLGIGIAYSGVDFSNEMVIGGAYGMSLLDRFALGGNVKLMRWALEGQDDLYTGTKDDDLSKISLSVDLSATAGIGNLFGLGDATAGVYMKNAIMPNISESGDDGGALPLEVGAGILVNRGDVLAEADLGISDGVTFIRLGAESAVSGSNMKIRGGMIVGSDFQDDIEQADITLGMGYRFGTLEFDYALNWPLAELEDTSGKHLISFGVSF